MRKAKQQATYQTELFLESERHYIKLKIGFYQRKGKARTYEVK